MKPQELEILKNELETSKKELSKTKKNREIEVNEYIEEITKLIVSIIEDEIENLSADTVYSWDCQKRIKDIGNKKLGSYLISQNNCEYLPGFSGYYISNNYIDIDLLYKDELATLQFDRDGIDLKKVEEKLKEQYIMIRHERIYPEMRRTSVGYYHYGFKKGKVAAAFQKYIEKREQIEKEIESNPKLVENAAKSFADKIVKLLEELLKNEEEQRFSNNNRIEYKDCSLHRKFNSSSINGQISELISPYLFRSTPQPELAIDNEGIKLSLAYPMHMEFWGNNIPLEVLKKELEKYNISFAITGQKEHDKTIIFSYRSINKNKDEKNNLDKTFEEYRSILKYDSYRITPESNQEKIQIEQDNFIKAIFYLIRDTLDKLNYEKGQITHTNKGIYEFRGADVIERKTIKATYSYDPINESLEYILEFNTNQTPIVKLILDENIIALFREAGIIITPQTEWYEKTYLDINPVEKSGYRLIIKCNLKTKEIGEKVSCLSLDKPTA